MELKASQQYWDDHWQGEGFSIAPQHHPIRRWIESEMPHPAEADVFEVGCYPGKFLAVFGERGCVLNGIDSFPKTNSLMSKWLSGGRYKIGRFYQSDFLSFTPSRQYDVVCSFGFIEHFKNWKAVLAKHIDLAKDGGCIMVDVPNLGSPLYYLLYKIFEPEILKNHELSALDKNAICSVFKKNGCPVKTAEYLGYFYFRFIGRRDKFSAALSKSINLLRPLFELLPRSIYARYIAVSAVKADPNIIHDL